MPEPNIYDHVATSTMERFCIKALPLSDSTTVAKHLSQCDECHQLLITTLGRQTGSDPISFTLAPEFWFRHAHIDYEQLVELSDNRMDEPDREIVDLHAKGCSTCREDVRSFLAFRQEFAAGLASHPPVPLESKIKRHAGWSRWPAFAWKPTYVAAAVVILGILVIGALVILKRRAASLEASRPPLQNNNAVAGQGPTREGRVASDSSASPTPVPSNDSPRPNPTPQLTVKNGTPAGAPKITSAAIALNDDAGRTVTIDQAGTVSGLNDVAPATRDEIAKALTEKIDTPGILARLSGTDITLRGPNSGQHFKLRSPSREVVITDRPSFEWDKLPGATSYRVYVGDLNGHEVAKSKDLSSDQTNWKPATPLTRGEIYSWAVAAIVDGKEVLSPGAAAPEMKFQVLSGSDLQNLNQLKRTRSHLVLGIFYVKVGLLAEGERELRELVNLNPDDEALRSLLQRIRTMYGTQP